MGIRFGLTAIKNVGVGAVEAIIKAREENGPFVNLFEFCCRVDLRAVNKKTIESLIQAGAFDSITKSRAEVFDAVEKAMQYGQTTRVHLSKGQSSLFEAESSSRKVDRHFPPVPSTPAWSESEKLSREKAVLGFYVSGHPLRKYEMEMSAFTTAQFGNPAVVKSGSTVRVGGILTSIKKKIDKKGNMMAFITMEDFTGKGEGIVFSDAYKQFSELLKEEAMILAVGKAEQNGDSLRIIVSEVYPMETVRERMTKSIILNVRAGDLPESAINDLRKVAERYNGKYPCLFNVILPNNEKPVRLQSTRPVGATDEFFAEVEKILGPNSVKISS